MEQRNKTLFLVEVAVFTALALLLDYAANLLSFKIWPQGGSISIAMVPIFLMAYRWGLKGGLLTGFLLGLLQIALGQAFIATLVQAVLEYLIAFALVGTAGIFADSTRKAFAEGKKGKWTANILLGVLLGSGLRYIIHFIAGIVYWGSYAPKGTPVVLYSLVYNGTYMLPDALLSFVVVLLVFQAAPRLIAKPDRTTNY